MSPSSELAALSATELVALFRTLDAPSVVEMDGEYRPTMLRQTSVLAKAWWLASLRNPVWPGLWQGKAFRPISDGEGRGYNVFRHFGRTVLRFPMRTLIAPSRYDGRPAYQLVYRAFWSACGVVHMVDEIRRFRPGEYLLIGTWGFTRAQRQLPNPFLLSGPVAPYRRDIGVERASYSLATEVPALNRSAP